MSTLELLYGRRVLEFEVPSWVTMDVLEATHLPAIPLDRAFEEAWAHPFGGIDLADALTPGDRVVLVVNDQTRPTPTLELLRLFWAKVRSRVDPEHVTVVVGTGTHRAPTEDELDGMLGEFRQTFRVLIHDCDRDLIEVGVSARGTRILVNRTVVEADHVIAFGHIGLHYYAGYSGGRKAILPAVAGREAIAANHAQLTDPESRACLYRGNPINDEMVEAARMVHLDAIIDVVFASDGGVAQVVIGESEAAHAAGRAFWNKYFQVAFSEPYDVVIASAGGHPKDIDLYQAYKAQFNAMRTLRDGGVLFLAAACPDGFGHAVFQDWIERSPTPEDVLSLYEREGFVLGGHKALYHAQDVRRVSIFLCTEMEDDMIRKLYATPVRDLAPVLSVVEEKYGRNARVLIMPHAADVFPVQTDGWIR